MLKFTFAHSRGGESVVTELRVARPRAWERWSESSSPAWSVARFGSYVFALRLLEVPDALAPSAPAEASARVGTRAPRSLAELAPSAN